MHNNTTSNNNLEIHYLYRFLREHNLLYKFTHNMLMLESLLNDSSIETYVYANAYRSCNCNPIAHISTMMDNYREWGFNALQASFIWEFSNEGHDFWGGINKIYTEYKMEYDTKGILCKRMKKYSWNFFPNIMTSINS